MIIDTEEALAEISLGRKLGGEHFEGDRSVELSITCEVHGAHATAAQLTFDQVPIFKHPAQGRELIPHLLLFRLTGHPDGAFGTSGGDHSGSAAPPDECGRN